ncbi:MAG: acyl-CoA dehydrogenase family protein [Deltaproteobacteria bacterium]|nr:MAG: acyl-CoA dehydrogenase family protein [Deltaproteobacteria bacterium]
MFELQEQHRMIEQAVRQFCEKELAPQVEALDKEEILPYDLIRKMMDSLGLRDMLLSALEKRLEGKEAKQDNEELDALDATRQDILNSYIIMKELSRVSPGFTMAWGASIGLCGLAIINKGNKEQIKKYGIPVLGFDKIGCWGLTEPEAGSDAFGGMKSVAKPDGDYYILNGTKTFITNAPYADIMVVYAKIDRGQPKKEQPVHSFILERGMEGLTTGKPFEKMGMKDSPTGEIFMEDVKVHKDMLLGAEKDNIRDAAKESLGNERSGMPPMALGIIEKCYEQSLKYANERVQFGRPIGEFQAVQLKLANMYIHLQNVWNIVYRIAWMAREGKQDFTFACASKSYCARAALEVAMDAIQIHGGYGYMREYHIEKLARDAKLLEIGAGTTDINLLTVARLELQK